MRICRDHIANELWDTHVTSWPRSVLKWILCRNHMGPGARVLEVRAEESGLASRARELGIDVTTRSPFQIELDRTLTRETEPLLWDLIVVRDHPLVHLPLHSPSALDCTSGLLSRLRPGGSLIIAVSTSPDEPVHGQHCWAAHLQQFGGSVDARTFRNGSRGWKSWWSSADSRGWQMVALNRVSPELDRLRLPTLGAAERVCGWQCECLKTADGSRSVNRAA